MLEKIDDELYIHDDLVQRAPMTRVTNVEMFPATSKKFISIIILVRFLRVLSTFLADGVSERENLYSDLTE